MKIQKHPNQPQPLKWLLVFHALFNFHDFLQTATAAAVSLNLQQNSNPAPVCLSLLSDASCCLWSLWTAWITLTKPGWPRLSLLWTQGRGTTCQELTNVPLPFFFLLLLGLSGTSAASGNSSTKQEQRRYIYIKYSWEVSRQNIYLLELTFCVLCKLWLLTSFYVTYIYIYTHLYL